jgi:flagellar FliL protein
MAVEQELKLDGEGSGNKKLIIIIIVLSSLLVLGGGVTVALLLGGGEQENVAHTPLNVPGIPGPSAAEVHYLAFETPFVIQVNIKTRTRMMQVHMALSTKTIDDAELAKQHILYIASIIDDQLLKADSDLYLNQEGREIIKQKCLDAIRDALKEETGNPVVDQLYYINFVMQ